MYIMAGVICAVYKCKNYGISNCSKSYFRFPKDHKICQQWIYVCKRKDLDTVFKKFGPDHLNKNYRVCSDHFPTTSFKNTNLPSQGLIKGQIPSQNLYQQQNNPGHVSPEGTSQDLPEEDFAIPEKKLHAEQITQLDNDMGNDEDRSSSSMEEPRFIKCESGWLMPVGETTACVPDLLLPIADDKLTALKVEPNPVFAGENVQEAGTNIVKEEYITKPFADIKNEIFIDENGEHQLVPGLKAGKKLKSMEDPVFIKCEPTWPSDTEEEPCNFEPNPIPPSDNQVMIKEDPHAMVADPCYEELNIKTESIFNEDEMQEAHDDECEASGGSSHDMENTSLLDRLALFSCDGCQRKFNTRSDMKHHLMTHTREKPYTCKLCKDTFKSRAILVDHMITHSTGKAPNCTVCGASFRYAYQLKKHIISHTNFRPFSCSICGYAFRDKYKLKDHILIHRSEKPFHCSLCNVAFTLRSSLNVHLRGHSGDRPHKCSTCGKAFSIVSSLNRHQITHKVGYQFSCHICGKGVRHKHNLLKHYLIHSEVKPFICDQCGAAFREKGNLVRHVLQHMRERSIHCST